MFRISLIIISLLVFLQLLINMQTSWLLGNYYVLINCVTFTVYAYDKSAARKSKWRIPELQLHVLSLLGGWWGALIAQQFLRHKSIKTKFLVVFGFTFIVNIMALVAIASIK